MFDHYTPKTLRHEGLKQWYGRGPRLIVVPRGQRRLQVLRGELREGDGVPVHGHGRGQGLLFGLLKKASNF